MNNKLGPVAATTVFEVFESNDGAGQVLLSEVCVWFARRQFLASDAHVSPPPPPPPLSSSPPSSSKQASGDANTTANKRSTATTNSNDVLCLSANMLSPDRVWAAWEALADAEDIDGGSAPVPSSDDTATVSQWPPVITTGNSSSVVTLAARLTCSSSRCAEWLREQYGEDFSKTLFDAAVGVAAHTQVTAGATPTTISAAAFVDTLAAFGAISSASSTTGTS